MQRWHCTISALRVGQLCDGTMEQAKGMQYVENHQCHEIPIRSIHHNSTMLREKAWAAGTDFKPAEHGTFDSRHEMHQVEVVQGL